MRENDLSLSTIRTSLFIYGTHMLKVETLYSFTRHTWQKLEFYIPFTRHTCRKLEPQIHLLDTHVEN